MSLTPKARLLYAEDDPDTREMIVVLLERENLEVVSPETLEKFLQLARDEAWDLFMLDTWMPQMSGFEICSKIKEFDSDTPIVFYSAAALATDKKKAFECGAFDYFVKPIPIEELIKGIHAAIASRPSL
jgi:DNA-binding response OmpR family regulator